MLTVFIRVYHTFAVLYKLWFRLHDFILHFDGIEDDIIRSTSLLSDKHPFLLFLMLTIHLVSEHFLQCRL